MSITLSNRIQTDVAKRRLVLGELAFDSSYPAGGETLALTTLGLEKIDQMHINPKGGYSLQYDKTNEKMKVFGAAPAIIYEEEHTAVGGLVTLDYPAAWIVNVTQAGQNMAWGKTQAFASLAANTFCLAADIADGVRTSLTVDGATDTILVTYATQAWAELYALLVQNEAVELATGANDLANDPRGDVYRRSVCFRRGPDESRIRSLHPGI